MSLSRLSNFLQNAEGYILYVNPTDFDATDSIENRGNSLTRPFVSIQRALIEAARFSYQSGRNNDRNDRTTILVYPGIHYIDNRPGYSIQDVSNSPVYKRKTGPDTWTIDNLSEFSLSSNFNILDVNNDLYKLNSVNGGVILPRGTSIIGLDLRKTKIRPLYVPDPLDNTVDNASIFNVTGSCYFSTFTIFDADTTKTVFKNYNNTSHVPNFSHHKLTTFAYADGVNDVIVNNTSLGITDLEMYYYKVAGAYGDISGRGLVNYPSALDFEPAIDEYRIVGDLSANSIGISSIYSGNGITPSNVITISTSDARTGLPKPHGLFVDSPISISGITTYPDTYNGSFVVREIVGLTTFTFTTTSVPVVASVLSDDFGDALVSVESDSVSSSSPYIFNCSLRSSYGLCGMVADGNKSDGFKSMVVAQFTGVSLQKDNNVFLVYDNGVYYDNLTLPAVSSERPLYRNSRSIYKPSCESYHIKCTNNAFIQCVSIFAIGFAKHFVTESGGDMSITNSNSNFGALSLESVGFRNESFDRDDVGYITHIIPPKNIEPSDIEINWLSLDATKTLSVGNSARLYFYGYNNKDFAPQHNVDNFKIGSKIDDNLYLTITSGIAQTTYNSKILMPVPSGTGVSSKKVYTVQQTLGVNDINITIGTITLTSSHQLSNGEKVRVISDTAKFPDGLSSDVIYYAITTVGGVTLGASNIQLASSYNDAIAENKILGLGNNGGVVNIVSYVSDKLPGDVGHPIQYDTTNSNWYISVDTPNSIYSSLNSLGISGETASTFFIRKYDNRTLEDRIYKFRYVIPKEFENARPPQSGFILQESKTVGLTTASYTGATILDNKDIRNEKVISNIVSGSILGGTQSVTVTTELPHKFIVGDSVKLQKVRSTNNVDATGITSSYNGTFDVVAVPNSKQFTYSLTGVSTNPGTFTNVVDLRSTRQRVEQLPLVSREKYKNNYFIYRVSTIKSHIPGSTGRDGVYSLVVLSASSKLLDTYGYGLSNKTFNQDVRNLYPQIDRDNFEIDPIATLTQADTNIVGKVITNDKRKSVTRESLDLFIQNTRIGFGITNVTLSGTGNTTVTINTDVQHQLNSIKSFTSTVSSGFANKYSLPFSGGTGEGATFKVVSEIASIVDPGSSYSISDSTTITDGTVVGVATVTEINNNVGDGIELSGFEQKELNGTYKILSIPNSKTVVLQHNVGLSGYTPNASGRNPSAHITSKGVGINSIAFTDTAVGIVTVTTTNPHGLLSGNRFTIVGSGHTVYDNTFVVSDVVGINTIIFNIGVVSTNPSSTTGTLLKNSISSNSRSIGRSEENLNSRGCYIYAGITTTLSSPLSINDTTVTLTSSNGFVRGDYVLIGGEILRLKNNPITNQFIVSRGQFATFKESNVVSGSLVKKIQVLPMEVRRPSFIRASGHTFEYLGYGSGNYSTSMPQKQSIVLDEDRISLSQSREIGGGTVVYTGMNDLGEFYSGSKKLISATGEEKVVDAPIVTYTGDDAYRVNQNIQALIYDDILIRERLTVEGGDSGNEGSQFFGPVNFTNKVTALSETGFEIRNLFLRGSSAESKLITVGIQTPTSSIIQSTSQGDISLLSNPSSNYIGHIYKGGDWKPFGVISLDNNSLNFSFDRLGIGRTVGTVPVGTLGAGDPYVLDITGKSRVQDLRIDGTLTVSQPVSLGAVSFGSLYVSGISTFGNVTITSDSNGATITPVVGIITYYGDGSQLTGIDLTKITNGTSNVTVSTSSTISATVGGSNIVNITGVGVSMVEGKRLDLSAYSENIKTFGSNISPTSGFLDLDISKYSAFVAYVGTTSVTFNPINTISGKLNSWVLILKYTNAGSRIINYNPSIETKFPGGKSAIPYSITSGVEDTLSFYTIDGGTNVYGNVVGLRYTP